MYDEAYGAAIFYGTPIMENIIGAYCFYRISKPFMKNKRRAVYVGGAYFLIILTLYILPLRINAFTAYLIGVLAAFFVMCEADRRNYEQKAFLAVIFFSLHWFTYAMAEILYDRLYGFAENTDYMLAHSELWLLLYLTVSLIFLGMELLFMTVGIQCILRSYSYKYENMSKKELLILVIPPFMGVVGYRVIEYYRGFYIGQVGKSSAKYDFFSLLYYAVAIITVVVVIVIYQNIKAGQEEKLQNELLGAQVNSIMQHIEQAESLYEDIRSIKHDMTNHIITLERLYSGNKTEEAAGYGMELKTELSRITERIVSGNPVTDVILWEMQKKAEKKNICFYIDFHFPADSKINSFDISVILNNGLLNAIENTDKSRAAHISVFSYRRNNAYMIEINNTFAGELRWDEEREIPVTSKKKKDAHGYGLANIRRVVEKYSGAMEIELKDGMFCLTVMLMTEQPS